MNIRRFTSRTIREAMAMVRAEFGDDAVILKTRSVANGVEIVAMADALPDAGPDSLPEALPRALPDASSVASSGALSERSNARPEALSAAASGSSPEGNRVPQRSQGTADADDRRRGRMRGTATAQPRALPTEPMSTLSFQQYVRDRLAQREQALLEAPEIPSLRNQTTMPAPARVPAVPTVPAVPAVAPVVAV
ncbi:MAG: hypothetical protein ABWZ78_02765, partial [Burkholderiaceae bacterium]